MNENDDKFDDSFPSFLIAKQGRSQVQISYIFEMSVQIVLSGKTGQTIIKMLGSDDAIVLSSF